jgi:hypothetical protein
MEKGGNFATAVSERSMFDRKDGGGRGNPPTDGHNHLAGTRKMASSHKNRNSIIAFLIAGFALSFGVTQA